MRSQKHSEPSRGESRPLRGATLFIAGLAVFLVLAMLFTTYVELHGNWLSHLQGKIERLRKRGEPS